MFVGKVSPLTLRFKSTYFAREHIFSKSQESLVFEIKKVYLHKAFKK